MLRLHMLEQINMHVCPQLHSYLSKGHCNLSAIEPPGRSFFIEESYIFVCFKPCIIFKRDLKCYYRPTASLQLNNKRNTKYNITVT